MVKNSPANGGDGVLIPGSGRSPGEGNINPLQCCCQGNPMGRGAWRAIVHGVAKRQTRLNDLMTKQQYVCITKSLCCTAEIGTPL